MWPSPKPALENWPPAASKRDVRVGELLRRTPRSASSAPGPARGRLPTNTRTSTSRAPKNVWRTCNTIDRGRQSRPRRERARPRTFRSQESARARLDEHCGSARPAPESTPSRRRERRRVLWPQRGRAPASRTHPSTFTSLYPLHIPSTSLLPPRLCASCTPGNKLPPTRTPLPVASKTTKSSGRPQQEFLNSVAPRSFVRGGPLA